LTAESAEKTFGARREKTPTNRRVIEDEQKIMKTLQRTLTIVKPDAVRRNAIGDIIEQFEKNHFRILAIKMLEISKHQAEQFYAVHANKGFFTSLTDFMSSGPIVALALEKENAIADLRKLMGATNPANAEEGTIRKKWAQSIEHNAIHGSDAEDTARFELSFFFAGYELAQ
jgi:nucleoside-diphosphate kinase